MFFVISGVYIIYIFGLGYWIVNPLLSKNDNPPLMEKIPIILTSGFLINHLILLLVQSLPFSLFTGGVISGCSLFWFFTRRRKEFIFDRNADFFPVVAIVFILILYYFTILHDPLEDWDARSIWFFHARMIWSAESLNLAAGWHHPSVQFSHVDYPKLIPALAAQISYVLGYWNEYTPKFSLFLILIPPVFWIFSFYSRCFSFIFLLLVFPFGLTIYLCNGSMDGYIAFYSAISVLLLGRYFKEHRMLDLMSAVSCLAMLSNIKNEGFLIVLAVIMSIAVTGILSNTLKFDEFKKYFSLYLAGWLTVIITPCILWSVFYKHIWNLMNDLQIGTAESFIRMNNRLSDGVSFPLIIKETIFHNGSAVWLALTAFLVSIILLTILKRHILSWIPSLITAVIYYCGIVIIYLMTPANLNWHLATSVQRTMLTVSSCMFAGIFFLLKELENAPGMGTYKK